MTTIFTCGHKAKNEDDEVSDITNIVNFLAKLTDAEKRKYKYSINFHLLYIM